MIRNRGAWRMVARELSDRVDEHMDMEFSRPIVFLVLFAIALGLATGPAIVLATNWQMVGGTSDRPTGVSPAVTSTSMPGEPAPARLQSSLVRLDEGTPSPIQIVAATATPIVIAATATAPQNAMFGRAPDAPTEGSADQAWQALAPALDAAWGTDTPHSVALLNGFRQRFPDYAPAREKLYAALLAEADDLARAGSTQAAADQVAEAEALDPERPQARATLQALPVTPNLDTQAPAAQAPHVETAEAP